MAKRIDKFEKNPKGLSAIVASVKHIFYAPVRSFIIVLVTSCALFLAIVSFLLWKNIDGFYRSWNKSAQLTVYLKKDIDQEKANNLVDELLKENKIISEVELIRPEDGMKIFVENTSLTSLISNLKDNPLPSVINIYPKIKNLSKDKAIEILSVLQSRPEVDVVKADIDWLGRSNHWLNLLDKFSKFFVFLLSLNAFFVLCGMSFSMTSIFREKNHLSKIVLQYQFAWYGLISSLFALLLIRISSLVLHDGGIYFSGLDARFSFWLIFASMLLSLIGSRFAAPK